MSVLRATRWRVIIGLVVAAVGLGVLAVAAGSPWCGRPARVGGYRLDLDVYRIGSTVWRHGGDLYATLPPTLHDGHLLFTYPPAAAILLAPLSLVSFPVASVAISALTAASVLLVLVLVVRRFGLPRPGWLLAGVVFPLAIWCQPVRATLDFGQINAVLMALVALDCLVRRPRWPRGMLVGLAAAVKLTPAVFVLWFLLRRDWRGALRAGLSFVVITGLTFAIDPHDSLRYWTSAVFDTNRIGDPGSGDNQSIMGTLARLGLAATPREGWWLLLAVGVLAVTVLGMRRALSCGRPVFALCLNGMAGLLCSPVSWSHHWVWAVPLVLSLVVLGVRTRSAVTLVLAGVGLAALLLPLTACYVYVGAGLLVAALAVPLRRSAVPSRGPLRHDEYLAMRRFPALDGLRAIAALLVVFFHNQGPDILQGWIGVQVFFVLSGFLITTLMLREQRARGRVCLRAFYARRAFRILPVYFLVLALTAGALLLAGQFMRNPLGRQFPLYLLFCNEFGTGGPYGQSWTLGIEQKFYLLWPLLAFSTILLGRGPNASRRGLLTVGLMTLALGALPYTLGGSPMGWPVHYFSILAGCLVALVLDHPRAFRVLRPLTKPSVATVVALGFLAVQLSVRAAATFLDHHRLLAHLPGYVAVVPAYALAVAILLPALVAPGPARWFLSSKPMVFLGERSYSTYLLQTVAQSAVVFVVPAATGLARAIPVAALAVLLAHGCYRWVERPMIGVGRGLIARRAADRRVSASGVHTITFP